MKINVKDILTKPGPLEGINILEYGVFHAGPGAGAILGDLGANVIKIEEGVGDPMRHWTRAGKLNYFHDSGKNPMFELSNRNKRCIYLDIKTNKGREIFNKLLRNSDIFLTNLRATTKVKLEIDYESIKKINPSIIYSSVSGYGKKGPANDHGAFDPLGQARSGMMYLSDENNPTVVQMAILDQMTAITASHGILTALFSRERNGKGQEVHNSLYSSALWLMNANIMLSNMKVKLSDLAWNRTKNSPLRNSFRCKDDKWIVGTHHPLEKYWPTFCSVMGVEELIEDQRFADQNSFFENSEELIEIFDRIFLTKNRDEWLKILGDAGLMFSPVQKLSEVLDDPQALANNYIVKFDHPDFGAINIAGYPVEFSTYSAGTKTAAPGIGDHTTEILKELKLDDSEIADLKKQNIVR